MNPTICLTKTIKVLILSFVITVGFLTFYSNVQASTIGKPPYYLTLNSGLVGHWTFDGNTITNGAIQDMSGNGNIGKPVNIATSTFYKPGKIGQGVNFDGLNDFVRIPFNSAINSISNSIISVSMWVYLPSSPTADVVFFSTYDGTKYVQVGIRSTGRITIWGDLSAGFPLGTGSALPIKTWKHITAVVNGSTGSLYIDGALSTSGSMGFSATTRDSQIGAECAGANSTTCDEYSKVLIDDVRVYNRALSATEISQLYNMGAAKFAITKSSNTLKSGLVGHWTFDGKDMSGGVARDISGQGNNGSLTNIATSTFYKPGKIGQGVNFDGVDDRVDITSDFIGTSALTISTWVRLSSFGGGSAGRVIDNTRTIFYTENNKLNFRSDGSVIAVSAANSISLNTWQYIVVTRTSSGTTNFYINGVLSGTADQSSGTPTAGSSVVIGNNSSNVRGFDGIMDDVRIYNRALSATEISQLYNMGAAKFAITKSSNTLKSGLVGHWTFDGKDMSGGVARDISGQGNNGTLVSISTSTFYYPGKIGQGVNFDGADDYFDVGTSLSFAASTPWTYSVWLKYTTYPSSSFTFFTGGLNVNKNFYINQSTTRNIGFRDSGSNYNNFTTLSSAYLGQWVHYTFVADSSNNMTLYINGANPETKAITSGSTSVLFRTFGLGYSSVTSFLFAGLMDDARVYNRALSATEVAQLYNLGR